MKKRTLYEATDPASVGKKLEECHFFLAQLDTCDPAENLQEFECYLSAFQNAFRTTIYRLTGVVKKLSGNAAKKRLLAELENHGDIAFLKDRTDLEIHGDGSPIWPTYSIEVRQDVNSRFASRWQSRFEAKTRTRFQLGYARRFRITVRTYQFEGSPKNLVDLCRDTLADLESIARRELGGSLVKQFDLAKTQQQLIRSLNNRS